MMIRLASSEIRRTRISNEARALQRTFGPARCGVTEEGRKLCNAELHNLYISPSIIRAIESEEMRTVPTRDLRTKYKLNARKVKCQLP
jgi:hypothetical protein